MTENRFLEFIVISFYWVKFSHSRPCGALFVRDTQNYQISSEIIFPWKVYQPNFFSTQRTCSKLLFLQFKKHWKTGNCFRFYLVGVPLVFLRIQGLAKVDWKKTAETVNSQQVLIFSPINNFTSWKIFFSSRDSISWTVYLVSFLREN